MEAEDRRLIDREPDIVGLPFLLDESKVLALLQAYFPTAGIAKVKKVYLRYKPATNCLVKYQVYGLQGIHQWYAKGYTLKDQDKLTQIKSENIDSPFSPVVFIEQLVVVYPFPHDARLNILLKLFNPLELQQLLVRVLYPTTSSVPNVHTLEVLQYKPERRLVAKLGMNTGESLVLKAYTPQRYQLANLARRRKLYSQHLLDVVGRSNKHRLLMHRWIEGDNLAQCYHQTLYDTSPFFECGRYLARFHQHSKIKQVVHTDTEDYIRHLQENTQGIAKLVPELAQRLASLSSQLSALLSTLQASKSVIHGDFYAKQVLLTTDGVRLIDFDDVCYWFSGYDLGVFIAHLERDMLLGTLSESQAKGYQQALIKGYRQQRPIQCSEVELFCAIGLLKLSHHPFRNAYLGWHNAILKLVKRCEQHLSTYQSLTKVSDLIHSLPKTTELFDYYQADKVLKNNIHSLSEEDELINIDVIRHKPNKRTLIEYTFQNLIGQQKRVLGKVKSKRFDKHSWKINLSLHQAQFGNHSRDGIHIPPPLGYSDSHQIWFQEKVAGQVCFEQFCHSEDGKVARNIALALYKLHSSDVETKRQHTYQDELTLLENYLLQASNALPNCRKSILDILTRCQERAEQLQSLSSPVTIHRDFYHDQVLIDNDKTYLLDLDLLCVGDPALDIGNFIAHIEEQCLRQFNQPDYAQKQIGQFVEHYLELTGDDLRTRIEIYTLLSWARHIFISHRISQRNQWTEHIIQLCHQRITLCKKP